MTARRIAAAVAVCAALVAPSAEARGTVSLDGYRRTKTSYSGTLSQPNASMTFHPERGLTPTVQGCNDGSCDQTQLRLTLPKRSIEGKLVVTVEAPHLLATSIGLYNTKGTELAYSEMTSNSQGTVCCSGEPPEGYILTLKVARLKAGRYTLVVFDRGGVGAFTAKVEYKAHPPSRPLPRR